MLVNLYLIFLWAPTEATMGNVQRIFYFHVPSAALGDVALVLGGLAAIAYLVRRDAKLDALSVSCTEVGLIFEVVNIVMGSMWAKPVWGIWWTWDARLTFQALLVLIYVGYLLVRQSIEEPTQRAVLCAVLSIFGMVDMPIVYMANRLFRTQHPAPVILGGKDSGLDPRMLFVLLFSMVAFSLLLVCLVRLRQRLEELRRLVHSVHMRSLELEERTTSRI
jgi:heme exporter protein C